MAARRLLDGFRVPKALRDRGARLAVVPGPDRVEGDVAVEADAGVFITGSTYRIGGRADRRESLGHASVDHIELREGIRDPTGPLAARARTNLGCFGQQ